MQSYSKAPIDTAGKFNGVYVLDDMFRSTRCTSGNYTVGAPLTIFVNDGVVSGSHSKRSTAKRLTGKAYADGTIRAHGFLYVHRTGGDKFTFVDGKIRGDELVAKVDQGLMGGGAHCDHGTYHIEKVKEPASPVKPDVGG